MILGFEGGLGSGKTLGMTYYLFRDLDLGFEVYANYKLNFDYKKLNVLELLESDVDLQNISIGIDEITVFLDCRKSSSKMNRLISYFILQTRKRNVNLYYTTQDFTMVDIRLIRHTQIQVLCEKIFDENGKELETLRKYTVFDFRNPRHVKNIVFNMPIEDKFGLFDTNEIILPPF